MQNKFLTIILLSTVISHNVTFMAHSAPTKVTASKVDIKKTYFGKVDGKEVALYTLKNNKGSSVQITNFGAIVTSLKVADKSGKFDSVVLGFDALHDYTDTDYMKNNPYFGSIVGRYGNRIAKGKFTLNGKEYKLATNNGENHLHGGIKGFNRVVWNAKSFINKDGANLGLTYLSKDGEEGYPGNVSLNVTYTLTNNNELKVNYLATTDKDTILNPTHHSYFNLNGAGNGDILSHKLMINADKFTPVDSTLITTGELKPVKNTPMDFTKPTEIGARINQNDEQLKFGKGYDHNWVLNKKGKELSLAASVYSAKSGRFMEVYTTEPGLQFYSGNFLDGSIKADNKKVYNLRNGFCLESQHYPDSPNKPNFPSVVLKPNQKYTHTTVYKFSTK